MNDITALAQRMKAAAKQSAFSIRHSVGMEVAADSYDFIEMTTPANVLALVEALESGDTENGRMARDLISRNGEIEGLRKRVEELGAIHTAAEKLVRCKGRYHSEQNYRALAALFGVNAPDLPPLESESRTVTVKRVSADQMHRVCLEATRHLDKYAAMAREVNKLLGSAVTNTTLAQPVTVKLRKRSVGEVMHMSGFSRDYAEGWCSGNDNAIHEMRAAGIQVIEGEQKND